MIECPECGATLEAELTPWEPVTMQQPDGTPITGQKHSLKVDVLHMRGHGLTDEEIKQRLNVRARVILAEVPR